MIVKSLTLSNFRNIASLTLTPSDGINVIYGENAQGKTNILESISYLSLISSFRASRERELIRFGEEAAALSAAVFVEERERVISVRIPETGRREVTVNRVRAARKADAAGILKCVLFCPEDLDLIRGSAALRRRFLDDAISQLWPNYISLLSEYQRLLQHKTRILKDYHEMPSLLDTLDDFSAQMCSVAASIIPYRERFCRLLSAAAAREHAAISSGREQLALSYQTVSTVTEQGLPPPQIYELLWQHYAAHKAAEIASGSCLSGPHKDDLLITIDGLPAKSYASQGQTRTAVLSLKLAQRELYFSQTGEYPVLLFDDVLSELDRSRQEYVLRGIGRGQVFITTCESALCRELENPADQTHETKLFHVKHGSVL